MATWSGKTVRRQDVAGGRQAATWATHPYHHLMIDPARLHSAYRIARDTLLAERTAEGYWVGELSASALSTATAVTALAVVARPTGRTPRTMRSSSGLALAGRSPERGRRLGRHGQELQQHLDDDALPGRLPPDRRGPRHFAEPVRRCEAWLAERYGDTPEELAEAVRQRYGKDRTFSVPILMMCALAGLVSWREVPRLPFELACLPQSWYRFARLPVVSYALPALIAIGQVIHHHRSTWNPLTRFLRWHREGPELEGAGAHPAVERRLPGGDAADEFRGDESGGDEKTTSPP